MSTKRNRNLDVLGENHLPRIVWRDAAPAIEIRDPLDIIKHSASAARDQIHSVCIVENISSGVIDLLQTEWGLDATFFNEYTQNPKRDEL